MQNQLYLTPLKWGLALLMACLSQGLRGQAIILDNPVRAGELTLFKSIENEHEYYYLLDKARLATGPDGKLQFSFLRYVENKAGSGKDVSQEGEGGGILHALVTLEVTEEQIQEAERMLSRVDAQGVIRGPALYKTGRFSLVSTFADTEGGLSTQVLGIGTAPILDGQKAAISLQLTKKGAKILWESFKTASPDISFSFEMELEGYRLPKRAMIKADFDQIYDHKAFAVGIATPYLGAEIKGAFDDMLRSGAIEVTQIGDDQQINELVKTAYNKISEMMFQPMNGSGTPSLSDITSMAGGQSSPLDRATNLLNTNRQEFNRNRNRNGRNTSNNNNNSNTSTSTSETNNNAASTTSSESEPASTTEGTTEETESSSSEESSSESEEGNPQEATTSSEESNSPEESADEGTDSEEGEEAESDDSENNEQETDDGEQAGNESAPSFAAIATFEMKRVRQKGTFRLNLNKYTADKIFLRFDENIGNLSRLTNDKTHFHQINMDQDFFRQREISTFIDGYNAEDFGQYINFVTVRMQKVHTKGIVTDQEVRIDRTNFNEKGNYFKMVYGWKDDADRRKWMEYQYEVLWSFFGGQQVKQELKKSTFAAINLKPPYERRTITLESDPEFLQGKGVRSITVSIFYRIGEEGEERVKKTTLNVYRQELSKSLEILLPENAYDYEYEITWRLKGNKTLSSGRQRSAESILFVDELPEESK